MTNMIEALQDSQFGTTLHRAFPCTVEQAGGRTLHLTTLIVKVVHMNGTPVILSAS